MSVKRRDHKNRILRSGESQRKDGRYAYKYVDAVGKPQFVYSWKLEKTDPTPAGKRDCVALREKEKEIQRDIEDGLRPYRTDITVSQLVEKYLYQKANLRLNTKSAYGTVLNMVNKGNIGKQKIKSVRPSDAKIWIKSLCEEGYRYSTIRLTCAVLRPSFQMAVDDDIIRKNPFNIKLKSIVPEDEIEKIALSEKQESAFLEFVKNDRFFYKYYDGVFILFKTGLRISEFAGLTISDIDLENKRIYVNNQLQKTRQGKYMISETKTNSGKRILPMTEEVLERFRHLIKNRKTLKVEPVIDGKTGFFYFDRYGKPLVSKLWQNRFESMSEKYNKTHSVRLPKITPHTCRHTYCSNMVKSGMNPKALQYLMGHSNINITLDVYTHFDLKDVQNEVERTEKTQTL